MQPPKPPYHDNRYDPYQEQNIPTMQYPYPTGNHTEQSPPAYNGNLPNFTGMEAPPSPYPVPPAGGYQPQYPQMPPPPQAPETNIPLTPPQPGQHTSGQALTPYTSPQMQEDEAREKLDLSRRNVVISSVVGLLAVVGGGSSLWAMGRSRQALLELTPTAEPTTPPIPSPTSIEPSLVFEEHSDVIRTTIWSPSGQYIASAGKDGLVIVWDPKDGRVRTFYRKHQGAVNALVWSPEKSDRIASGGADQTVQLWEVIGAVPVATWEEHNHIINGIAWSPEQQHIASCDEEGRVLVWTSETRELRTTYTGHEGSVLAVTWSADGRQVASVGVDGTAQIWDALTGETIATITSEEPLKTIMWQPEGDLIAIAGDEQIIQIVDATSGEIVQTCSGHTSSINTLRWSPDGRYLASGDNEGNILIWEGNTGKSLVIYNGHRSAVNSLSWDPVGKQIASGGEDQSIHIWTVEYPKKEE